MKKTIILALALCLVFAGIAVAGVVSSKHDMRIEDSTNQGSSQSVCEYCHHPHRGTFSSGTNALIWNKNYVASTYAAYASTATLAATPGAVDMAANLNTNGLYATALCMSCHDGANASNNIIRKTISMPGTTLTLTYSNAANLGSTLADDHPLNFVYTEDTTDDIPATLPAAYPLYANYFQCSTCHNVHMGNDSAAGNVQFMRGNTTNSDICIDCHTAK